MMTRRPSRSRLALLALALAAGCTSAEEAAPTTLASEGGGLADIVVATTAPATTTTTAAPTTAPATTEAEETTTTASTEPPTTTTVPPTTLSPEGLTAEQVAFCATLEDVDVEPRLASFSDRPDVLAYIDDQTDAWEASGDEAPRDLDDAIAVVNDTWIEFRVVFSDNDLLMEDAQFEAEDLAASEPVADAFDLVVAYRIEICGLS